VARDCEDDSQINSAHPNLGSEENFALLFDSSESRTEQSSHVSRGLLWEGLPCHSDLISAVSSSASSPALTHHHLASRVYRYYHRSLNPKKLIEVGFSPLHKRMTMSRTIKLYKLPTEAATPGFRQMVEADVDAVTALLESKLTAYRLAPVMDADEVRDRQRVALSTGYNRVEGFRRASRNDLVSDLPPATPTVTIRNFLIVYWAQVRHWLLPRPGVIDSFVVEEPETKRVTDFVSYYALPSTIIGNDQYQLLKAAYCYYHVAATIPLKQLMNDALIMVRGGGGERPLCVRERQRACGAGLTREVVESTVPTYHT
jgi:hypothetical protein